jgi:hypothetical protein
MALWNDIWNKITGKSSNAGGGGGGGSWGSSSSSGGYSPVPQADLARARAANAAKTAASTDYSSLLKSLSTYQAPVAIPSLNLTNIYNKARAQAEASTNPWFSTQLSNYTKQRDLAKKKALEAYTSATNEAKMALEKTLGETATGRVRTEEDTATNLANISGEEANRQDLEALQYDQSRREAMGTLGEAGLTTSGLGRQQLVEGQKTRQLTEKEQARVVSANVNAQNLTKTRTLADLASTDDWAKKAKEETYRQATSSKSLAEQQANFDLEMNKLDAEIKRMEMVSTATRANEQQQWRDYLSGLSSAQRERASSVYGGYF